MISITKGVISNEILNSPNCGVEGSHSPNEQDPRCNENGFRAKFSRKITADFLWGKGQLSLHPTCPEKDDQISPYAQSYLQSCIQLEKISNHILLKICISFFSFLFIFLFLDAQERLTFMVFIKKNLWASKSVKQIDDALMHSSQATASSFLHFKGRGTVSERGSPKFPPLRWHIRGSWQLFKCLCCLWNSA